ncbi:MAG TPA: glutamate racemase [Acidimicrobiia bacterium]|nr:glutamate racemase [Acidimicrobiia bacterium]
MAGGRYSRPHDLHDRPAMIGVFDSGVGGLSVLVEIRRALPAADVAYLADRGHAPYGSRALEEVRGLAEACTSLLVERGAEVVVLACNTASAAALDYLRRRHPEVTFVGMEPALKPAVAITRNRVVGVLATAATFQGELFASVIGRFGKDVEIVKRACPGWADLVETAELAGGHAESVVAEHLEPVLARGADTLVLGCTHYPFLRPLIRAGAGAQVALIDPAPAVARRVASVWGEAARPAGNGRLSLLTTGATAPTQQVVARLTGIEHTVTPVTLPAV